MKQSKLRKLNLKFKYLTLELEEVTETHAQYTDEWNQAVFSLEKEFKTCLIDRIEKKSEKSEKSFLPGTSQQVRALSGEDHEQLKNLYYQAAKQVHPDHDPDCDPELMQRLNQAYHDDNLADMLDIFTGLKLDLTRLTDEHVKLIEKNITQIQDRIKHIRSTDAWVFCTSDETVKNNIIQNIRSLLRKRAEKHK